MNSKKRMQRAALLALPLMLAMACELPVAHSEYQEGLVVFGHLVANAPVTDTLYVSLTSSIEESHEDDSKWVSDASVTLSDGVMSFQLLPVPGRPGRYLDLSEEPHVIEPGVTYSLEVRWRDQVVRASTMVPELFSITSIASSDWSCQGQPVEIGSLDLYQEVGSSRQLWPAPSTSDFSGVAMDTVYYREGPCYTSSFASIPLFLVEWEAVVPPGVIRTTTLALEDTIINAIVDTGFAANAFKGPMLVDDSGNVYRSALFSWNSSGKIIPFSWLYFNYYGAHLVTIEVTDDNISEYFEGDPLRQNAFSLPDSNIDGGYGLFYSSYARSFLVYVAPESV